MSWRKGRVPDAKKWAVVRVQVLDRDGWRCVKCGRYGRMECDHIKPLEDGGDVYTLTNLQALCRGCHIEKTRQERQAKAAPPAVTAWRDFVKEDLPGG